MKLQTKPNRWSCLATAMAMALDIDTEQFYELAGHDGSEIKFDWLPEPQQRRGFHIQEAIHVARQLGYSATPFELIPRIAPSYTTPSRSGFQYSIPVHYGGGDDPEVNKKIFDELLATTGVVECVTAHGNWHAVAFHNNQVYDPDGKTFPYSMENFYSRSLYPQRLWQVAKCSQT